MPKCWNCKYPLDLPWEGDDGTKSVAMPVAEIDALRARVAELESAARLAKPILSDRSAGGRMLTTKEAASEAYAAIEAALLAGPDGKGEGR